jgi:hypothetical protein
MNKSASCIYLFPVSPLFNLDVVPIFEKFDRGNSIFLYQTLVYNHVEIFRTLKPGIKIIFCFDERDRELIPMEITSDESNLFFGNTDNKAGLIKKLADKYFDTFNNNLLIFSNSIGFYIDDIYKSLDLLSIEDDAVVLGKSISDRVAFIGLNTFKNEMLTDFSKDATFDKILQNVNMFENFVHVQNHFMTIDNLNDFRILYTELSKKESLAYCSQHIHERFTNLFIEYRYLLKC